MGTDGMDEDIPGDLGTLLAGRRTSADVLPKLGPLISSWADEDVSRVLKRCLLLKDRSAHDLINPVLLAAALLSSRPHLFSSEAGDFLASTMDRFYFHKKRRCFSKKLQELTSLMNPAAIEALVSYCVDKASRPSRLVPVFWFKGRLETDSAKVLFNSLLLRSAQLDRKYKRLLLDVFGAFEFDGLLDGDLFRGALVRNAAAVSANLSLLLPEWRCVADSKDLDTIYRSVLSSVKSSDSSVAESSHRLLVGLLGIAEFGHRYSEKVIVELLADRSYPVERRIGVVGLLDESAVVFDSLGKLFARESNDALKREVFWKMSRICCRSSAKADEVTRIAKSCLSSPKQADKRCVLKGLCLLMSRGCIGHDGLSGLFESLTCFFNSADCANESVYVCQILRLSNGSTSVPGQVSGQVSFLKRLHSNGILRLDRDLVHLLCKLDSSADVLRIALSLYSYSTEEICEFAGFVQNANDLVSAGGVDVKNSANYNRNLQKLLVFLEIADKDAMLRHFLSVNMDFSYIKKFVVIHSKDLSVERLVGGDPHLAKKVLDCLCRVSRDEIPDRLARHYKSHTDSQTFLPFVDSALRHRPQLLLSNLYDFYDSLVRKRGFFPLYLLLSCLKFESKSAFECAKSALFGFLIDGSADSLDYLDLKWPPDVAFLVMMYPVIRHHLANEKSTAALGKLIAQIGQFSLRLANSPLISLMDDLIRLGTSHPVLIGSIDELTSKYIETNAECFDVFSERLQSMIDGHFFSNSIFAKRTALSVASRLPALLPGTIFKIWTLRYDESAKVSSLATDICSRAAFAVASESLFEFERFFFLFEFELAGPVAKGFCSMVAMFEDDFESVFQRFLSCYTENSLKNAKHVRQREESEKTKIRLVISECLLDLSELVCKCGLLSSFSSFFFANVIDYENEDDEIVTNIADTFSKIFALTKPAGSYLPFITKVDQHGSNTKGKTFCMCSLVRLFDRNDITFDMYFKKCLGFMSLSSDENTQSILARYISECWNSNFVFLIKSQYIPLCMDGASKFERRGAAYLVATFVKKLGLPHVRSLGISDIVQSAATKKASEKEGCLYLIELLSLYLSRAFEPYAVSFVPFIISCFGEGSADVKQASNQCITTIMKSISSHGLSLALPVILKCLEDTNWKTKAGAVLILGSMCKLAPKLLSKNLQAIIPKLGDLLKDPHPQVQLNGKIALDSFANQVRTPEIRSIAPVLLATIADPNSVAKSLDSLLGVSFGHYLQDGDLCILFPVLSIGLQPHRSSDVKRRSAQILGNLLSLVEADLMKPYIGDLLESLLRIASDSVAEVRSTVARVIGSLFRVFRLENDSRFDWVVPDLFQAVEEGRLGVSQSLAEVLGACNEERFCRFLPRILEKCRHDSELVRCGYLNMFVHFPATVRLEIYSACYPAIFPVLLQCLCDSSEAVRDLALKSCQLIFKTGCNLSLSDTSTFRLLERGMLDQNFKVRLSTLQLISEFLSNSAENKELLAILYISRMDPNSAVRLQAFQVWKTIVKNSPKTIRENMAVILVRIAAILDSCDLALAEHEHQPDCLVMAVRTIEELCSKFDERVLGCLLTLDCYGEGYCYALYLVLQSAPPLPLDGALLDVVARLANFVFFLPLVSHLKSMASRQVEELLFPNLMNAIASGGQAANLPNMIRIKGFSSHLIGNIINTSNLTSPKVAWLLKIIEADDVVPYAEDVLEFILSSTAECGASELDLLARSLAKGVCSSYGLCDVLLNQVVNSGVDPKPLRSFYLPFIVSLIPQASDAVVCKALCCLFRLPFLSEECSESEIEAILRSLSLETPAHFNAILAECASAERISANVANSLVSYVSRQLPNVGDALRVTFVELVLLVIRNDSVKVPISLIGFLIRALGEKASMPFRLSALRCLSLMLSRSSTSMKPFVPQLQRLCIRNISLESNVDLLKGTISLLVSISSQIAKPVGVINELIGSSCMNYDYLIVALCAFVNRARVSVGSDLVSAVADLCRKRSVPEDLSGSFVGCAISWLEDDGSCGVDLSGASLYPICEILFNMNDCFNARLFQRSFEAVLQSMNGSAPIDGLLYCIFQLLRVNLKRSFFQTDDFLAAHLLPFVKRSPSKPECYLFLSSLYSLESPRLHESIRRIFVPLINQEPIPNTQTRLAAATVTDPAGGTRQQENDAYNYPFFYSRYLK